MLRLGIDIDGVLADFNKQHIADFKGSTGRDLFPSPDYVPHTWNYPQALGYTPEEVRKVWTDLNADPLWWTRLEAYPETRSTLATLEEMIEARQVSVHFLTTRPSETAHWQTVTWLQDRCGFAPQVCVCKNAESKATIARGLGIDVFIDDNIDNILAMKQFSPETIALVFDQPWNRAPEMLAACEALQGVGRVTSLKQFIEYVEYAIGALREEKA